MQQKKGNNSKNKISRENKKKVFIFSFEPKKDKITQTFLSKKVGNLLKKHDDEIVYVFVTKFSLPRVLKIFSKTIEPKTGYIICNNGACLYDISKKKIIFKSLLSKEVKSTLIHVAELKSFLIASASGTKCSLYSTDIMKYKSFINNFSVDKTLINNYLTFRHYIYENDFLSFIFYDPYSASLLKEYKIFKTMENDLNVNFSKIENNMFCVTNSDATVEKTYIKILELLEKEIDTNRTYYFVLNSFDEILWNIFSKNHYMNILHWISYRNSFGVPITPQNIFIPENIDKIISAVMNNNIFIKKYSISNIEKEYINLRNKNQ